MSDWSPRPSVCSHTVVHFCMHEEFVQKQDATEFTASKLRSLSTKQRSSGPGVLPLKFRRVLVQIRMRNSSQHGCARSLTSKLGKKLPRETTAL